MELPTPPRWFVKALKEIHPALGVRWDSPAQGWQIFQNQKRQKYYGIFDGMRIFKMEEYPTHVMYTKGLGSAILDQIKRARTTRYTYEEYCKEFGIQAA